jgi:hypothetical protein
MKKNNRPLTALLRYRCKASAKLPGIVASLAKNIA